MMNKRQLELELDISILLDKGLIDEKTADNWNTLDCESARTLTTDTFIANGIEDELSEIL